MDGGDRRLQLVSADGPSRKHFLEDHHALVDEAAVPPAAVLFGQRHEVTARVDSRRPPSVREQHESEGACDLVISGQVGVQLAGEVDRLLRQRGLDQSVAGAPRIPLVEDEVENVRTAATRVAVPRRSAPRIGLGAQRGPGAAEPLGNRRLGTRNAAAMAAVVSPETARRVSATCKGR